MPKDGLILEDGFVNQERLLSQQSSVHSEAQAQHKSYALHSLDWKSFEKLCQSIADDVVQGADVQTFSDGKDEGRDGAFHGCWQALDDELMLQGKFVIQCKHSAKPELTLKKVYNTSTLKKEFTKVRVLFESSTADHYLFFTSCKISAPVDAEVTQLFKAITGSSNIVMYGVESLSRLIQERPKLRRLVPRVYGLGDLSQILDERLYQQTQDVLLTYQDELACFVDTEVYHQSLATLDEHGFAFLLGNPLAGKTLLAYQLAVVAMDLWQCIPIEISKPFELKQHYNPHEKQLFIIDDAFGTNECCEQNTADLSRLWGYLKSLIKRGSKVIMTSRLHLFREAQKHCKPSNFPLLSTAQTILASEALSLHEHEAIVHAHLQQGNQSEEVQEQLCDLLPIMVTHEAFSPEIARLLAHQSFTEHLELTVSGIKHFITKPEHYLLDTFSALHPASIAALAMIFLREGTLAQPITITTEESDALAVFDNHKASIIQALRHLDGSFTKQGYKQGVHYHAFKNTSLQEAFAQFLREDINYMPILLKGESLGRYLTTLYCGDMANVQHKTAIPQALYPDVIARLHQFEERCAVSTYEDEDHQPAWRQQARIHRFLIENCDKTFLKQYIQDTPTFIPQLQASDDYRFASHLALIQSLHNEHLLPTAERLSLLESIKDTVLNGPSVLFMHDHVRSWISDQEYQDIKQLITASLLPHIDARIEAWRTEYNERMETLDTTPSAYFYPLSTTLHQLKKLFNDSEQAQEQLNDALAYMNDLIEDLDAEQGLLFDEDGWDDG